MSQPETAQTQPPALALGLIDSAIRYLTNLAIASDLSAFDHDDANGPYSVYKITITGVHMTAGGTLLIPGTCVSRGPLTAEETRAEVFLNPDLGPLLNTPVPGVVYVSIHARINDHRFTNTMTLRDYPLPDPNPSG